MFNIALKDEQNFVRITETAQGIFERTKAREIQLSRLLTFYVSGGLLFILLPGRVSRRLELVSISGRLAGR
jgi:hypothetical protein